MAGVVGIGVALLLFFGHSGPPEPTSASTESSTSPLAILSRNDDSLASVAVWARGRVGVRTGRRRYAAASAAPRCGGSSGF